MQLAIKISKIYFNVQYVGPSMGVPSLFYCLDKELGEIKDIYKLKTSFFYQKTPHLVVYGDTHLYQPYLEHFLSYNKTLDIIFNIRNPVVYPVYSSLYINVGIVIDKNISNEDTQLIKKISTYKSIFFILPVSFYRYDLNNLDERLQSLKQSNIHPSLIYVTFKDDILKFKPLDKFHYTIKDIYKKCLQYQCKFSYKFSDNNLL